MRYQLPTFKAYAIGLLVLIAIALAASVLLPSLGVENQNIVFGVVAGLLIGHLVGTSLTLNPAGLSPRPNAAGSSGKNGVKTLYVGNLAFHTSKQDLYELFKQYGTVYSSRVMFDRITRRSRGFGFVEMSSDAAEAAIAALDGADFSGRNIRVNEATNQTPLQQTI